MKHFKFDHDWDAIKGRLKQRYGQLADDDLTFIEGKGEELLARLREKLGMSEEEVETMLSELHAEASGTLKQMKDKAGEFADEARARVGVVAADLKARAAAIGDEAKAQALVVGDHARQRVRVWREEGEEYVRQNPRESLLAAVCAGFVAGLLIRR